MFCQYFGSAQITGNQNAETPKRKQYFLKILKPVDCKVRRHTLYFLSNGGIFSQAPVRAQTHR